MRRIIDDLVLRVTDPAEVAHYVHGGMWFAMDLAVYIVKNEGRVLDGKRILAKLDCGRSTVYAVIAKAEEILRQDPKRYRGIIIGSDRADERVQQAHDQAVKMFGAAEDPTRIVDVLMSSKDP